MKQAKIDSTSILLVSLLVVAVLLLVFSTFSTVDLFKIKKEQQITTNMPSRMSHMSLTSFDKALARQLMDQNNDGRCDICGMPVEQCIDAGQIECSMGSNAKTGVLGSQHIHADWKVYINGKKFDWAPYADRHERQMAGDPSVKDTSAFIHIHPAPAPEKGGDVLHMHATGVPLWVFFKSLGIELPNTMKLYVNGSVNPDGLDYVFKDLDKLLLTDATDQAAIQKQLSTITDYAKEHSKPGASSG